MYLKLPKSESEMRLAHLFSALEMSDSSWDTALIFGRINMYYLTGTIQDGVLVLRRNGDVTGMCCFLFEGVSSGHRLSPRLVLFIQ